MQKNQITKVATQSENFIAAYDQSTAGYSVGVLHINSKYALIPGNVQHTSTFPFPVFYVSVNIDDIQDLFNGESYIEDQLVKACEHAYEKGVRAIVGACGSFGYYQKVVAARLNIPVFLSVLTQVPFIQQSLGTGRLGVICASQLTMNARIYEQCDITSSEELVIAQMKGRIQFDRFISEAEDIDFHTLERETIEAAQEIVEAAPDVKAILLQCSDLPPFGRAIQRALDKPVFDASLLIRWLHLAADYPYYCNIPR